MSTRETHRAAPDPVEPSGTPWTYEEYRARRYFHELDGLRAVSILLVFSSHIDALFWDRLHGGTGVTFFFVLSGYLITTLSRREEHRRGRLDLRAFYIRRVFRIYPLYATVLAGYAVLILVLGFQPERRAAFLDSLPYYLLFLPEQALLNSTGVEPPFAAAWSLGIEEKFYFVWPIVGFWLLARSRHSQRLRIGWLVVMGTLFAFAPLVLSPVGYLLRPYALIAMGCVLALLLDDPRWYRRLAVLGRPRVFLAVLLVVVALQLGTDRIELDQPGYVAYGLPVTLLLAGLVTGRHRGVAVLSSRPLVFLGTVSYAFYLTHGFALNLVQALLPLNGVAQGVIAPVVALGLAVFGSWVLHRLLEQPLIKVGHRLAQRHRTAQATPTD